MSCSQLPVLFLLTVQSFSVFGCKEYNQPDFSIDYLVNVHVQSLLLCCWNRVFAMTSAFSWQNSVSFCPASFCSPGLKLPVTGMYLLTLIMLKILQARVLQYVNQELPDIQAVFRKGRGTRDQIASIHWLIEKAREFPKKHLLLLHQLHKNI